MADMKTTLGNGDTGNGSGKNPGRTIDGSDTSDGGPGDVASASDATHSGQNRAIGV